jgi:hypothetical protein
MAKKKSYDAYVRQQMGDLIDQLQLSPLNKQSLKERWLDQMIWADKKATQSRRSHYQLRLTAVVGGVILPALVGVSLQMGQDSKFFRVWFPSLTFGLSQVIAVSVAIEEFCKFGDRWRDYRKMAEDLKSEGWHYLQSSGPYEAIGYEPVFAHERKFAQFTNRVESIIKNDVQSYISGLVQQQSRQDAETQKVLAQAQAVTDSETPIGAINPTDQTLNSLESSSVAPSYSGSPTYANPLGNGDHLSGGYSPSLSYPSVSSHPSAPVDSNFTVPTSGFDKGQPPQIVPVASVSTAVTTSPDSVASQMVSLSPATIPNPAAPPAVDLNVAILKAAKELENMSTAGGPDGGRNACAWTVNQVLRKAGIPELGSNPDYVPDLLKALQTGRGKPMSPQTAKAGDLVIAYEEAHIGISMDDGCQTVLSNSSSQARFCWRSDIDFQESYGGSSTVYRLLR